MIRFASFNVAMSADSETAILEQTATLDSLRFKKIAATIQSVRPDVLFLCEFDHLGEGEITARCKIFAAIISTVLNMIYLQFTIRIPIAHRPILEN